jgi:DNA polymerase-3 subunit gamma/tau
MRAGQLHRLWQLLLKGHDEVKSAPDPLVAAQMALLRIMHAADMPDPGSLVKKLEELASRAPAAAPAGDGGAAAPGAPAAAAVAPRWEALVDDVEHFGQPVAANVMRMQVRVVELAPGVLRYTQPPGFNEDISGQLRSALGEATGDRWQVERVNADGAPTLVEQAEAKKAADTQAVRGAPLVEATLAAFPGAELIEDDRPAAIGGGSRNWRR